MIDSSNSVGSLVTSILGERGPEPVEQPAPAQDTSSRPRRQTIVPAPEELERLLQAREQARNAPPGNAPSGLNARRALATYTAVQDVEEREYVARVLGVDVRV